MNHEQSDTPVRKIHSFSWDVSAGHNLPAIPPGKTLVSTTICLPPVSLKLYPVARLTLILTGLPAMDPASVRAMLDETIADLNAIFQAHQLDRLIPDDSGTGEQPDGSYRYIVTTIADANLPLRVNLVALLLAKQTGKNTVRVQAVTANTTLCEVAA